MPASSGVSYIVSKLARSALSSKPAGKGRGLSATSISASGKHPFCRVHEIGHGHRIAAAQVETISATQRLLVPPG